MHYENLAGSAVDTSLSAAEEAKLQTAVAAWKNLSVSDILYRARKGFQQICEALRNIINAGYTNYTQEKMDQAQANISNARVIWLAIAQTTGKTADALKTAFPSEWDTILSTYEEIMRYVKRLNGETYANSTVRKWNPYFAEAYQEILAAQKQAIADNDLNSIWVGPGLRNTIISQAYANIEHPTPGANPDIMARYKMVVDKYNRDGTSKTGALQYAQDVRLQAIAKAGQIFIETGKLSIPIGTPAPTESGVVVAPSASAPIVDTWAGGSTIVNPGQPDISESQQAGSPSPFGKVDNKTLVAIGLGLVAAYFAFK